MIEQTKYFATCAGWRRWGGKNLVNVVELKIFDDTADVNIDLNIINLMVSYGDNGGSHRLRGEQLQLGRAGSEKQKWIKLSTRRQ